MRIFRRILGILVICAGALGLMLSLTGLIGLWVVRPAVETSLNNTISTLTTSIDNSQKAFETTNQALVALETSVDALSDMLNTTAGTVAKLEPVIAQANSVMSDTLPASLQATSDSLAVAQKAAQSLEGAIKTFEKFRADLSATPLLGSLVPPNDNPYNPDKPMAESLGTLSTNIGLLPAKLKEMSTNLDQADNNLGNIQNNLITMSKNAAEISNSLREYQAMIAKSMVSMARLKTELAYLQNNLSNILTVSIVILSAFFIWLFLAQVVILSYGWNLFQNAAGPLEGGTVQSDQTSPE